MKKFVIIALAAMGCGESKDERLGTYETAFTAEENNCVHVTLPNEVTETIEISDILDIEDSDAEALLTYVSGFNVSLYLVDAGFREIGGFGSGEIQGSREIGAITCELGSSIITGKMVVLIEDRAWNDVDITKMTSQELLEFLEKHPAPLCGAKYIFDGEKN